MTSPTSGAPALKYGDENTVTPSPGEVKGLNNDYSCDICRKNILINDFELNSNNLSTSCFETYDEYKRTFEKVEGKRELREVEGS